MHKIKHMGQHSALSRRERQVMEVLYRKGSASVAQLREGIADKPSYSAVRVIVNVLERKGYLRHELQGRKYVYSPVTPRKKAMQGALRHVLDIYFEGSVQQAVAAMVELKSGNLSDQDLEELARAVRTKRRGGRR
jgi:BlaI family penicillinase repressor